MRSRRSSDTGLTSAFANLSVVTAASASSTEHSPGRTVIKVRRDAYRFREISRYLGSASETPAVLLFRRTPRLDDLRLDAPLQAVLSDRHALG
jgi:hypothetical protein